MNILEKLNRRYASKAMNGTKIPEDKKELILESIRLAPTSMGLQPFKVLVVENQEVKQKIFDTSASGQLQIPSSAFTLVFAVPEKFTTEMIEDYFVSVRNTRKLPEEKVVAYRQMVEGFLKKQNNEEFHAWAARQVYIALGFALYTAALLDVDSVPIEGFTPALLDEVLDLKLMKLRSVCMMAVGNRHEELDYNARLPKLRKSADKLFVYI
jgi:nitroreductase